MLPDLFKAYFRTIIFGADLCNINITHQKYNFVIVYQTLTATRSCPETWNLITDSGACLYPLNVDVSICKRIGYKFKRCSSSKLRFCVVSTAMQNDLSPHILKYFKCLLYCKINCQSIITNIYLHQKLRVDHHNVIIDFYDEQHCQTICQHSRSPPTNFLETNHVALHWKFSELVLSRLYITLFWPPIVIQARINLDLTDRLHIFSPSLPT